MFALAYDLADIGWVICISIGAVLAIFAAAAALGGLVVRKSTGLGCIPSAGVGCFFAFGLLVHSCTPTPPPPVKSLVLTGPTACPAGTNVSFKVDGLFEDQTHVNCNYRVLWSSEGAPLNLTQNGTATASVPGNVTIIASLGGLRASTQLQVVKKRLLGIKLEPSRARQPATTPPIVFQVFALWDDGSRSEVTPEAQLSVPGGYITSNNGWVHMARQGPALLRARWNGQEARAEIFIGNGGGSIRP